MAIDILGYAYAVAVTAGGIVGFVKKGSIVSAVMGILFGGMSAVGAYFTSKNPADFHLSLFVSLLLCGIMSYRYINTGKVMPAGIVAVLSILMIIRYGSRFITTGK